MIPETIDKNNYSRSSVCIDGTFPFHVLGFCSFHTWPWIKMIKTYQNPTEHPAVDPSILEHHEARPPFGRPNGVHPGFLGGTEYHVHELHGSTYIRTTTENLIQNHYNINFRSLQTTLENYTKNSTENSRVFQKDHDSHNGPPSSASKCPSPPRARKKLEMWLFWKSGSTAINLNNANEKCKLTD